MLQLLKCHTHTHTHTIKELEDLEPRSYWNNSKIYMTIQFL